ncbi:hypothetical protein [Rhizobium leguminosarum]|uniref:hypothetical protein n=1 Tax=Rhizobium leguminosarum TaxID=384 RepID=UPI003CFCF855
MAAIKSSVESLQNAYADDGKFLVNIRVDGKQAEVKVDAVFLKVLNDLNRRF